MFLFFVFNRINIKCVVLYFIILVETKTENKHENSHENDWNGQVFNWSSQDGKEQPKVRCIICGSKIWRKHICVILRLENIVMYCM